MALALALTLAFTTVTFAQRDVKVFVGGTDIEPVVAPIIIKGRVMLPVRAVFEAIKAKVSYDAAERKVTAIKKDITVEFVIDSKVMTINGEEKEIDVPATIVNGRTLVPLRACAEAFNLDVAWNGDRYIAKVKYPVALVSETVLPNSDIVHKYTYDENGDLLTQITSDEEMFEINEYDSAGRLIKNTIAAYGMEETWEYGYDENGRIIYTNNPGGITKYTYNEFGDILTEEMVI